MKPKFYVQIAEPCHEDWNTMSPVQQGRYCNSCCKQVVDFTAMSDSAILKLLSKAAGNTCGRFKADQLERPLVQQVPYSIRPYKYFAAALIPALVITGSAMSQDRLLGKVAVSTTQHLPEPTKGKPVQCLISKLSGNVTYSDGTPAGGASIIVKGTEQAVATDANGNFYFNNLLPADKIKLLVSAVGYVTREVAVDLAKQQQVAIQLTGSITLGEVVFTGYTTKKQVDDDEFVPAANAPRKIAISGQVVDATGQPLPYATVTIVNSKKDTIADSSGKFSVMAERRDKFAEIVASYAGYDPVSQRVAFDENDTAKVILALSENKKLPDVLVSTYATSCAVTRMGGISMVKSVTPADTVKLMTSKLFKNVMFKAYPNPVVKGGEVQVRFKEPGSYTIHLFDNEGRLYQSNNVVVEETKAPVTIPIPASLVPGNYFLKAVNQQNKKQFADKIIIQ